MRHDVEFAIVTGLVAIVDTVCPRPYALSDLGARGLGGTEATVVRVAEALDAEVFQHNRTASEGRYHPLAELDDPQAMIVLRDPKAAADLITRHGEAQLVIWMHDLVEPGRDRAKRLAHYRPVLAAMRATVVGVSEFHTRQIEAALRLDVGVDPSVDRARLSVRRIYNPLADGLSELTTTDIDRDQMIFFSAPAKGLDYAMFAFGAIRRRWPRMRLLVANPAYAAVGAARDAGVVDLGSLPHRQILDRVARSLCAFCTNFEYPETFGLVLAESNAVGTPVITHPIGAAAEVVGDSRQVIATPGLATVAFRIGRRYGVPPDLAGRGVDLFGGFERYVDIVGSWREGGRPVVRANPSFDLDTIASEWKALLGTASASTRAPASTSLL